jgi:hypothetical protein
MRTISVTIGTLLVVGVAVTLLNCGDDSSPGGAGATGGTGGTGATGGSGGSGGSTGGTAGTGGSSGAGMQDSGTDQGGSGGSSGAAGSGGKGGGSGASGSSGAAGKAGGSGAAGSAGSGGKDGGTGGSADASSDAAGCPSSAPQPGTPCTVDGDCIYGPLTCTCSDPGPNGSWLCSGGPSPEGGGGDSGGMCPATEPSPGDPCPDGGYLGPCLYDSGHSECTCDPAVGWGCIRH